MSEIFNLLSIQRDAEQSAFKAGYDKGKGIEKEKTKQWRNDLRDAIKSPPDEAVIIIGEVIKEMEAK